MKSDIKLKEIIKKYNGGALSLRVEGRNIKRYVVPCSIGECLEIGKLTYKKLNEILNYEEIYSISFLSNKRISEVVGQNKDMPLVRGIDISTMKETNPEDWIRICGLFPEKDYYTGNLPSVYQ